MLLKFHARPGHVVPWPDQNRTGQVRRYIGRQQVLKRDELGVVIEIGHPAQEEPVEIESQSRDGQRVVRLFNIEEEAPLYPADQATAKFLGVPFVAVELKDGEFSPKAAKSGKD